MYAGFTGGVTTSARQVIRGIRAWPRIFVRIVAGGTGKLLALAKTAARHEANRRESHINGIFELRFVARVGACYTMAFPADLRLRGGRQSARIQHLPLRAGASDMRAAGSVAALALHAWLHGFEIRSGQHVCRVATEAMGDGPVILQHT